MKDFEKALHDHGSGDLAKAEARYLAVLAKNAKHVGAIRLLGLLYHQQGKHSLAADLLERATVLSPTDANLRLDTGVVYKIKGSLDRAADHLQRAATLDPTLIAAHLSLGEVHMAQENWEAAINCFRSAVKLDKYDANALTLLGNALHLAERPHESLVAFTSAITLNPQALTARIGAGTSLCAIGDHEGAAQQFAACIASDNRCLPAWYNLGCIALKRGSYHEAVSAFTSAIKLRPHWSAAHINRALSILSAGDLSDLPAYEWRFASTNQRSDVNLPRCDGAQLTDETLLVYLEQHLGSAIHFLRLVNLSRKNSPNIVLHVQPEVLSLLNPFEAKWSLRLADMSYESRGRP